MAEPFGADRPSVVGPSKVKVQLLGSEAGYEGSGGPDCFEAEAFDRLVDSERDLSGHSGMNDVGEH